MFHLGFGYLLVAVMLSYSVFTLVSDTAVGEHFLCMCVTQSCNFKDEQHSNT